MLKLEDLEVDTHVVGVEYASLLPKQPLWFVLATTPALASLSWPVCSSTSRCCVAIWNAA